MIVGDHPVTEPKGNPFRVPSVVPPIAGESLLGILLRHVERNSLWSVKPLIDRMSAGARTTDKIPFDTKAVSAVADMLSLNAADAFAAAHVEPEGSYHLVGKRVSTRFLATTHMSFCPACLEEAAFHRAVWNLSVVPLCVRHRCLIRSSCPRCEAPVGWFRARLLECPCGHDLRSAPHVTVDTGLGLARHVDRSLRLASPDGTALTVADEIGIEGFLDMVYVIGWRMVGKAAPRQPSRFALRNPREILAVMDEGWAACNDLPGSFVSALTIIRDHVRATRGPQENVRDAFGSIGNWINERYHGPWGKLLHQIYDDHAVVLAGLERQSFGARRYKRRSRVGR